MAPLIYLADQRLYPLSFGLYAFQVQVINPGTAKGMGMVMADSLLMTLPVIHLLFRPALFPAWGDPDRDEGVKLFVRQAAQP